MKSTVLVSIGIVTSLAAVDSAQAALVTLTGTQFDVIYDTTKLGLFDAPTLVGDSLFFTPAAFSAQSLNGAGTHTTSSLADGIQLVAHSGYVFGTMSVTALGDYQMQGVGSAVSVAGTFSAVDDTKPLTATTSSMVVTPAQLNVADGLVHNWYAQATISDATPTLVPGHNPWLGNAGVIDIALQNALSATTVPGPGAQQAFIQEKFSGVQILIDPVPVPLPAAAWLLGSGLVGLAGFRRQKLV